MSDKKMPDKIWVKEETTGVFFTTDTRKIAKGMDAPTQYIRADLLKELSKRFYEYRTWFSMPLDAFYEELDYVIRYGKLLENKSDE